jgi:carbonic anhydrase/acetyltransferase-like protein (isoleucine patch superfamily)
MSAAAPIILDHGGVSPRIAADAFVAPGAVVIGDVEIGPGASVWFGCVLRGDGSHIRVGARSNLQDGTIVHVNHGRDGGPGEPTLIGAGVVIGHMALIHACTIEDGAFIGMRATVMDRAVVERGAMVAAGALVTPAKRLRSGELWSGVPAKLARALSDAEKADIPYIANHYAELAARYRRALA